MLGLPLEGFALWRAMKATESQEAQGPDGAPGPALSTRSSGSHGSGSAECGRQQLCARSCVISYARYGASTLCSL